jgi:hypothetical protein
MIAGLLVALTVLASCSSNSRAPSGEAMARKPLAQKEIVSANDSKIDSGVHNYASAQGFAVYRQDIGGGRYIFDLYREDLLITVARPFASQPVIVTVLPLCACESAARPDLGANARQALQELSAILGP